MNILLIHHILEFHHCKFDGDHITLSQLIETCLKKNNLNFSSPIHSWQEGDVSYISESNTLYFLLLQYYPQHNTLLCDFQIKRENKTRLFSDIKNALNSRNFTSLEIKRGVWDKNPLSII